MINAEEARAAARRQMNGCKNCPSRPCEYPDWSIVQFCCPLRWLIKLFRAADRCRREAGEG